jgi:hypothetical protein
LLLTSLFEAPPLRGATIRNEAVLTKEKIPMLIKIVIAAAVIIIVFVVIVALQRSEFHVARSATMSAPAPAVFAQVNDFHKWDAWNPWGKIDPAMKQTYEARRPESAQFTRGSVTIKWARDA